MTTAQKNITAPGLFVVGLYGDSPSILTPTATDAYPGGTLKDAQRAIAWQNTPRDSETDFRICEADPETPGVMICAHTRERFTVDRGALTREAHGITTSEIWGYSAPPEHWEALESLDAAGGALSGVGSKVLEELESLGWVFRLHGETVFRLAHYGRAALKAYRAGRVRTSAPA